MLRTSFAALCALTLLAGCANPGDTVYSADEVGRPIDIERAVVVHGEKVTIDGGENSGYGAVLGATAAGVGAHSAGSSDAVAVLAAVIGLGVGYAAEEMMDSRDGIRYVLLDEATGHEYVVIQNADVGDEPLASGTAVLVEINGSYTRVIPAPPLASTGAGPGGGSWVNPDGTVTHSAPSEADDWADPDAEPETHAGDVWTNPEPDEKDSSSQTY